MIEIIVAQDLQKGIGKTNSIPWHFSYDMKYFSKITKSKYNNDSKIIEKNNILIMGRKTFDSLPKLLVDRFHIVLSSNAETLNYNNNHPNQVLYVNNLHQILELLKKECNNRINPNNKFLSYNNKIFVIGGGQIYNEMLEKYSHFITNIYITNILQNYDCDTFFPKIEEYSNFVKDEKYSNYREEKNVVLEMTKYYNNSFFSFN